MGRKLILSRWQIYDSRGSEQLHKLRAYICLSLDDEEPLEPRDVRINRDRRVDSFYDLLEILGKYVQECYFDFLI